MYKIETWTARGVTTTEAPTKALANLVAARARGDGSTLQTVVIFPNGTVRVCRNPKATSK